MSTPPTGHFVSASQVAAAVTGLVQYIDTEGGVRRETTVHAALNNVALGLYVTSAVLRTSPQACRRGTGRRRLSGWWVGDIAFRHGVGVRPRALNSDVRRD
jgi:hypothetical protein